MKRTIDNRGAAVIITIILMSIMLVIAVSAVDIVNKGLAASNISGRSAVSYLAAESGAERMWWYAATNPAFESPFFDPVSGCLNDYIDISVTPPACGTHNHLISADTNYYYRLRHNFLFPYHIYESVGNYFGARRSIELKYAK